MLCRRVIVVWILVAYTAVCIPLQGTVTVPACTDPYDGSHLFVGESYHERCNLCTCNMNGKITCTNRTCGRRRGMPEPDREARSIGMISEYEYFLLPSD